MTASRTSEAVNRYPTLAAAFLPPFTKVAAVQPGERVLDVAPVGGEAAVESALRARRSGQVLSVGTSPESLQAVERAARDADLTVVLTASMDPEHLDLGNAYWDLVTCHFGLPDIADPEQALAEMRRVLRPAGRLALSVLSERDRCPAAAIFLDVVGGHVPAARAAADALFRIAESGRLSTMVAGGGFEHAMPDRSVVRIPFRDANDYWDYVTSRMRFGRVAADLAPDAVDDCKAEITRRARLFARRDGIELALEAIVLGAVK
jgi:SAM-dependent methyltransferase